MITSDRDLRLVVKYKMGYLDYSPDDYKEVFEDPMIQAIYDLGWECAKTNNFLSDDDIMIEYKKSLCTQTIAQNI